MNKTVQLILAVAAGIVISLGLFFGGILIGKSFWGPFTPYFAPAGMPMHQGSGGWFSQDSPWQGDSLNWGSGRMGWSRSQSFSAAPLAMDEVDRILHEYLEDLDLEDLSVGEIMIFDNHAYAQIIEESTGIGALEVLVDPLTKRVYPEHGPNLMWNLKYRPMGGVPGRGMISSNGCWDGGMIDLEADFVRSMSISSTDAVEAAQAYLDQTRPGTAADDQADVFYGYYTLHVLQDGEVVGMLSVQGESGQVIYHSWHGELIEMSGH